MSAPARRSLPSLWLLISAAALVLLGGFVLRFAYYKSGTQVDEPITHEVVRYMRLSGDWDVNWAKADLEPGLRYDQYNFSSHMYATFFFYRFTKLLPGTEAWRGEHEGFFVYRFFVALLACVALLQTLALGRKLADGTEGWLIGTGGALLAAVTPLLVQDAHYLRPEPFTTVLTLAAVALCWPQQSFRTWRVLAAAGCVGLLVACKISLLMLAWLPFVPIVAGWRTVPRPPWLLAGGSILAMVAGFSLGAPGAWLNPDAYWNGVQFLMRQYAYLHPPHSHFDPTPVGDMMARYFVATLGWPMLACFAVGTVALLRCRRWTDAALLAGPVAIFAAYFATRSVFFERNLSHVVPLACILAAFGTVQVTRWVGARLRLPIGVAATALFAALALQPAAISHALVFTELAGVGHHRHEQFEEALRARYPGAEWRDELFFVADEKPLHDLAARLRSTGQPAIVRITDYRDERTASHIAGFKQRFVVTLAAENPGTFPSLPTCTLLTYHRPTFLYFLVTGVRDPAS